MPKNPLLKIRENAIMTASPQELTLMLYDGAIKFCNQAIVATEERNISLSHEKIKRVEAIIRELRTNLNHDYEVAESMDKMYEYMNWRLFKANIAKDPEMLNEVLSLLRDFRDTWKEAMKIAKDESHKKAL